MHHKGKETEMLNANMFAFNNTSLHFTQFANYQTIKQPKKKCKLAFKGTSVKKNKRLSLIGIKHTDNHIYVIIGLQRTKQSNVQTYKQKSKIKTRKKQ